MVFPRCGRIWGRRCDIILLLYSGRWGTIAVAREESEFDVGFGSAIPGTPGFGSRLGPPSPVDQSANCGSHDRCFNARPSFDKEEVIISEMLQFVRRFANMASNTPIEDAIRQKVRLLPLRYTEIAAGGG